MTSVEEFKCILCKESFENKDELQTHFRKHGDPKFHESIKSNKSRVQNEAALASEKSNDASEMVNCDVCDEVFPTISKAITHKHKVHPEHEAKYFCPWCGKLFTMKHLYNKHLQSNHDAVDGAPDSHENHFHCDCCSVYFFLSSAMIYHNKFFHRQDTDLPIIGHSKKQKLWNQDLLPVYYCSFCGEEYINKVNLHKHICDDHGDENQRPSDVLRCPLCEAIFYHLDAYELHLTFHSSDDLYCEANEMNENELPEYSLETVPPAMERVEDLNNLPDAETDVNAIGIESFLQMAMDEPHNSNQGHKKVKSKKHKKHKKSKKSAITLDEFLNMNQDVFGEGLDFQGVEEVPTKVVKRQLIPKKPQIQKAGAKLVSSADLQKLQKQGIVVKMKSGKRPPTLQVKPVGQPVKVNPRVKNLTSQTQTKAISASNEVLSKLMNQSSNQLKIVKKSAQEKAHDDEPAINEPVIKDNTNKSLIEDSANSENVTTDSGVENSKNVDQVADFSPNDQPKVLEGNQYKEDNLNNSDENKKAYQSTNAKSDESENIQEINNKNDQSIDDQVKLNAHQKRSPSGNTTVVSGNDLKDTLKNISRQITIKPVTPPVTKTHVQSELDESFSPKADEFDEVEEPQSDKELTTDQINVNPASKTLDPLRNINSAITIKSLKNGSVAIDNRNSTSEDEKTEPNFKQSSINIPEKIPVQKYQTKLEKQDVAAIKKNECAKVQAATTPSHVLKNLSKNITVKSTSPSIKQLREDKTNEEQDDSEFDEHDDRPVENKNVKKLVNVNLGMPKNASPKHKMTSDLRVMSTSHSPHGNVCDVKAENMSDTEQFTDDEDAKNSKTQSSSSLLKHLKNITAKPVTPLRKNQLTTATSINKTVNIAKGNNYTWKNVQKQETSEEIETFNIDDSDSDDAGHQKIKQIQTAPKKNEPIKHEVKPNPALNAIKNISKHVTIKSSNNQTKQIQHGINIDGHDSEYFSDDEIHDDAFNESNDNMEDSPKNIVHKVIPTFTATTQKDQAFKNAFKNLGKQITVKSKNTSSQSIHQASQDSKKYVTANDDSDEGPASSKVKITDVTEDNFSDDDIDHTYNYDNKGIVTHSSEGSISGDDHFADDMDEFDEYESQPKVVNTSNHNFKSPSECLLKNISKNITVKSLTERNVENEGRSTNTTRLEKEKVVGQNKFSNALSVKSTIQNKPEIRNESAKSRSQNSPNIKRIEGPSTSNHSANSAVLESPGVVNTVNKEVKLKTFQSETVIEEITTTVTKTIRRVNQVNQQVYNTCQTSSPKITTPQKHGPRMGNYNQPSKNFQGVTVRHTAPGMPCQKIRQAIPYRPAASTPVRPSNQLVPIRPNANIRPGNSPRIQIKNMPQQQRPVGKPLKISPNAMNQIVKRPTTEDASGPFSCFKKQKESLIPGHETAAGSGSALHYTASSQTSKFCSTSKMVRDNAVFTKTQMKSESISQRQQMSRHGNISGLKMSKAKQVSKVESSEGSASKRSALEAIEKLQKQGLLIKKPRVEEDLEPPNSGGEDSEEYQEDEE